MASICWKCVKFWNQGKDNSDYTGKQVGTISKPDCKRDKSKYKNDCSKLSKQSYRKDIAKKTTRRDCSNGNQEQPVHTKRWDLLWLFV